jgi:hypothetical protein
MTNEPPSDPLPPELPDPRLRWLIIAVCLALATAMVLLAIAQQLR